MCPRLRARRQRSRRTLRLRSSWCRMEGDKTLSPLIPTGPPDDELRHHPKLCLFEDVTMRHPSSWVVEVGDEVDGAKPSTSRTSRSPCSGFPTTLKNWPCK